MFSIYPATSKADVERVAPLFDRYRVFYGQSPNPQGAFEFLHDRWLARDSQLFFAREDGDVTPLGFVQLYGSFFSDTMLRCWILNDLFVDEPARRRGVGRALMQRAERHAVETGSGGLTLSTAVDNVRAQALYESEGYLLDAQFLHYNRFIRSSPR